MLQGTPADTVATIGSLVLSTDAVEPERRYEYWRSLYEGFAEVEVAPEARPAFWARNQTWHVGPFAVMAATGAGKRFLRNGGHCARDGRDLWVFRLSPSVSWTAAHDGRAERIPPGALWMKRTNRASLTQLPTGDWRVLMFSGDACPELSAGLSRLEPGRLAGPGAGLLADILTGLPARLGVLPRSQIGPLADVLRAAIASCLLTGLDPASIRRVAGGPLARERVIRVIDENIGSALLDVDRICRLANVSRTVLYRLFESDGGVAHFVRDRRLDLIAADLRNPDLVRTPLCEIAQRRGFYNAPCFSRAFRRAFGCSPSEARVSGLLGAPYVGKSAAPASDSLFDDLLGRSRGPRDQTAADRAAAEDANRD